MQVEPALTDTPDHHEDCLAYTKDSPIARQALHASTQTRSRGATALTMSWRLVVLFVD
eukprot:CAMPEP_0204045646 /NCGR_PEP_ID=MMETSP0360-20130528/108470_1 /ASSEMBLY_ACC=CAM_ASM_000342 /TAXON_ID=268821 /ORGANISM="Scrippsiella Hangoei, Strain SHTV-5" /LENGTH=57 /DNA_ID=CAMNT_0050992195 /DNA_START=49 /DNA_END=219 /DNA_ORIENTATION=-